MDLTTGNQFADTIVGLLILLGGGGGVMKLKRLGFISFGRGNGNPSDPTRKQLMSKESKKEIGDLWDKKQSKELCRVLHKNLDSKLTSIENAQIEIGKDVKALLSRGS